MNKSPRLITEVFTLPGSENRLNALQSNDLVVVVRKEIMGFPKEGVFMVYVEYEDYREPHDYNDAREGGLM